MVATSTMTKHPFYTPFHINPNQMHVINRIKLVLHLKKYGNLWERAEIGLG